MVIDSVDGLKGRTNIDSLPQQFLLRTQMGLIVIMFFSSGINVRTTVMIIDRAKLSARVLVSVVKIIPADVVRKPICLCYL